MKKWGGGGGNIYITRLAEANMPPQAGDREESGLAGRHGPLPPSLAPTPREASAVGVQAQSPALPGESGPRAPSRMGQDMTARFVHQHP